MIKTSNTTYSHIRGFNYQPGYAANGVDVWLDFREEDFIKELSRGREYFPGFNTVRLWFSLDAYVLNPEKALDAFDRGVRAANGLGLRVMPVLFNGWFGMPAFGGLVTEQLHFLGKQALGSTDNPPRWAVLLDYVRAIQARSGDWDLLMWDLCNEPLNNAPDEASTTLWRDFLASVRSAILESGDKRPITIGCQADARILDVMEPLSDVVSLHPYYAFNCFIRSKEQYETELDAVIDRLNGQGKPALVTECCWGSLDDAERTEVVAYELGQLSERGLGFLVHLLHATRVADGHLPADGPVSLAGYMAFINKDGSLRAGHDIFNQF